MDKDHDPSSSDSLEDDFASKSKLCIKFKIPNNTTPTTTNQGAPPAEDGGSGDLNGHAGHIVCEYCGKRFSSGKAWGGHKRHHLQMNKKSKEALKLKNKKKIKIDKDFEEHSFKNRCATIFPGDIRVIDRKPTCCLCNRTFRSMKLLFDHMKFHPARAWKGIQLPPLEEPEEDQGLIGFQQVDLTSGLVGWLKKARRGRVHISDEIEAALTLMSLSRHGTAFTPASKLNLPATRAYGSNPSSIFDPSTRTAKKKKLKSSSISKIMVTGSELRSTNEKDDEIPEEIDGLVLMEPSFNCDICKKKFPTGQALGGHKRSHRKAPTKAKPEVLEFTGESTVATASSGEAPSHPQAANGTTRSFDLNEPYVLQDEDEDEDEDMSMFSFKADD